MKFIHIMRVVLFLLTIVASTAFSQVEIRSNKSVTIPNFRPPAIVSEYKNIPKTVSAAAIELNNRGVREWLSGQNENALLTFENALNNNSKKKRHPRVYLNWVPIFVFLLI